MDVRKVLAGNAFFAIRERSSCMHKKKLKELNLLDDFLFFKMLNYPEIGEEFSRELLKIIFGKSFEKLVVVPQKVYYGSDTDKHGPSTFLSFYNRR